MQNIEGFDSKYRFVLVAARRARQIQAGARPLVQSRTRKAQKIAQEEIQAGQVQWSMGQPKSAVQVADEALERALNSAQ